MVDSSKVPPAASLRQAGAPSAIMLEQPAKVASLPAELAVNIRAQRIEGEVVRVNQDGTTRVQTDKGTVDIQLRRPPEVGTRVQIDVPAGQPPRQVIVRPAPAAPQPAAPSTTPPSSSQPAPTAPNPVTVQQSNRPLPTVPQTPLPPSANLPPAPQTSPLPEQVVVRLLPLPAPQAQNIAAQTLAQTPALPTRVDAVVFQTNLVVQNARDTLVEQIVNLVRPAAAPQPSSPGTPALTTPAPKAAPLPGAVFASQPATTPINTSPQTFLPSTPAVLTISAPTAAKPTLFSSVFTQTPVAPGNVTPFQPAHAFLQAALTNQVTIAPKAQTQLDVLVAKIAQPPVQLIVPGVPSTPVPTQGYIPPITAPLAAPSQIVATVIGTTPQAQPVISLTPPTGPVAQATSQFFTLQFPASNLPIGAQIALIPQGGPATSITTGNAAPQAAQMTPTPSLTPAPLLPLTLLQGSRWPVLNELLQTLQQANPDMAQAMARALPSPASPRSFPAAVLLFVAAAKADLANWLGDKKIEALRSLGRSGLLSRLTGDGQQMARLSSESLPGGDWRAVPLPLYWDNEIQKITLYFKRDDDSSRDPNDDSAQTRFVFDLELSRIGPAQLDGLMRGKRLDLIVRTQNPFSQPMMAHMKQLYASAIKDVSLNGELSFQGNPKQWVNVVKSAQTLGLNA